MNNSRGTTLIELMVAMLVFSISLAYGLTCFIYARAISSQAEATIRAIEFCKTEANNQYVEPFNSVVNYSRNPTDSVIIYNVLVNVTPEQIGSYTVKKVNCWVSWQGQVGKMIDFDVLVSSISGGHTHHESA